MSGAVDRSGCKPFCGLSFNSLRDGQHEKELASWRENPGFCQSNGTQDSPIGCTARCRDLALPPIAPVAGSASPVGVPLEPMPPGYRRCGIPECQSLTKAPGACWHCCYARENPDDEALARAEAEYGSDILAPFSLRYLGPTPATPPVTNPPPPAASPPAPPSRQLVGAGAGEGKPPCNCGARGREGHDHSHRCDVVTWNRAQRKAAPRVHHAPGISCPSCLVTSAGGDQHTADCPRGDFSPRDAALTSEAWSAAVRLRLHEDEARRRATARPFIPSVTDEDLFGKAVR